MTVSIPRVIEALLSLAKATFDGRIQVIEGEGDNVEIRPDLLTVGYSVTGGAAVEEEIGIAGLNSDQEAFRVNGAISSIRGDAKVKPRRDAVFGWLEEWRAAIKADPTLGGACTRARLTAVAYAAGPNEDGTGTIATVGWTISVDAFLR